MFAVPGCSEASCTSSHAAGGRVGVLLAVLPGEHRRTEQCPFPAKVIGRCLPLCREKVVAQCLHDMPVAGDAGQGQRVPCRDR